ncbi:hypothetical protein HHL22_12595 [Hymenobacter sp. RP-2-7]|uniref:Outer membrane protein beta-barrel domain-containing protein n=1 Tax=Hymenobacter polaris TaxID=2682546 RepID=A0A7Y0FN30_9BACT|nr:hypothetical protein [Hymenobacter polaris]NML66044.1 hypothetical protein [Hymenobacter polaris]
MRTSPLFAILWLATLGAAHAGPPGYHAPRRRYNARNQAYIRPAARIHGSLNVAYYNGDLTNRLSDNTLRVGYGVGVTQALSPRFTFSSELSVLYLKAKDFYPGRGYSFESTNGLLQATLRYNIFEDKSMYSGLMQQSSPAQLFVEAGAGLLLTSPTAYQNDGAGGAIQLPAEGRNSYPLLAGAFPVGIGGTLKASPHLYFTLDALYYFTTTDLLDDISQRANPRQPDNFATLTLKVEYAFGKKRRVPLTHYD